MARLSFHGAAETVTGSKYLLEAEGAQLLIDCGLFQGLKSLRLKNWGPLPFQPAAVDCVVLTHAHIDHSGYLPRFVQSGFQGPVYCTPPTAELTELLLLDSANNQERDAEYANRKGFSKHHPAQPLYNTRDAANAIKQLKPVLRGQWQHAAGPFWYRFSDAGHLLGSSMIEVEVRSGSRPLRILFSGDVGRYDAPLYHDPAPPPECDYLICESTYGDRLHTSESVMDQLADEVGKGIDRGGVILVASFAVGRAQQLIFLLRALIMQKRIPPLPIFLDSPMAINATDIYTLYSAEHDLTEMQLKGPASVLDGGSVRLARSVADSKRINEVDGPAVIISSSGMMVGGRILHHLRRRLPDPKNTILIGGFMAAGTRGRRLQEGAQSLRIHGRDIPVKAALASMSGLSGHADRDELLRWLTPLRPPSRVFLTHGEKDSALALADRLRRDRSYPTHVPSLGETVELELPA